MTELDEVTDKAVKDYADAIVEAVTALHPDIAIVSECEDATSEDQKYHAAMCDIQTEMGFVTIFPDFKNKSAKAAILNRGMVAAMQLEGFDDDDINNAPVYSDLFPPSAESLDVITLVLTEDLDLQHQKNLD
jgi:hypothetical protein